MKKRSHNKADGVKDLLNDKSTDANETIKERVVMHDECGDTLWDAVLKQDDENLLLKNNKSNVQPVNHQDKIK